MRTITDRVYNKENRKVNYMSVNTNIINKWIEKTEGRVKPLMIWGKCYGIIIDDKGSITFPTAQIEPGRLIGMITFEIGKYNMENKTNVKDIIVGQLNKNYDFSDEVKLIIKNAKG